VLPAGDQISPQIRAGLPTVAVRIPHHPLALALLEHAGPLVAPSANLSGRPSATTPGHVEEDFGSGFPVLDGGACQRGLESTILGLHDGVWEVFRLGSIPPEAFQQVLGYIPGELKLGKGENPLCPGQLYRHYAPKARLFLSTDSISCEAIVGYTDRSYPKGPRFYPLGSSEDPIEVSKNLYDTLRQLDQQNISTAWVDMRIPQTGLWKTIIERLEKAAVRL
jgi:L-threonylcarbamoyladenylate synthase